MPAYEVFAKFYDAVMGDRAHSAQDLLQRIRQANPQARSVLELGCGTGSVLKHLQRHYEVSGLDASPAMLAIARKKVPRARLFHRDMVNFAIDRRFDVICCVFDSINHVRRFSDWKRIFANVRRHLSPHGCFIFDINTRRKLQRHIGEPPWIHRFGKNLLIMDVTALPHHASNWNIRVFEHRGKNRYLLHEENIVEVSFPQPRIEAALRDHFGRVEVVDPARRRATSRSERLIFITRPLTR